MKRVIAMMALLAIGAGAHADEGYWSIKYELGIPMLATRDFVASNSYRGLTFEGRRFVTPALSVGGSVGWNTFHDEATGLFSIANLDITGTQFRRIYMVPLLVTAHYYLRGEPGGSGALPFAGLGIGAYHIERLFDIGVFQFTDSNWHFALAPEIGVFVPAGGMKALISVRYSYAFKAGDGTEHSYIGIGVGLSDIW